MTTYLHPSVVFEFATLKHFTSLKIKDNKKTNYLKELYFNMYIFEYKELIKNLVISDLKTKYSMIEIEFFSPFETLDKLFP